MYKKTSAFVALAIFATTIATSPIIPYTAHAQAEITAPTKSLKEILRERREARRKKLPKIITQAPQATFDEYQVPELNNDQYEPQPIITKKSVPSEGTIPKNTFDNIILSEPIPTSLFQNEIFTIRGQLSPKIQPGTMFAFLNYSDGASKDQFIQYETETNGSTFEIPLYANQEGNFLLGIVASTKGKSKVKEVQISNLNNPSSSTITQNSSNLSLTYNANLDASFINWQRTEDAIYKIIFEQNGQQVTYITRQNVSQLPIQYADFKQFKPGNINIFLSTLPKNLSGSWKNISNTTAQITYHGFRTFEKEKVSVINEIPYTPTSLSTITLKGKTSTPIEKETYVTTPQGQTEKVVITKLGTSFTFKYTPKTSGRYIIELNDTNGSALVNIPIYINSGIPLVPDYVDIGKIKQIKKANISLSENRNQLLQMINIIREGEGIPKVSLDSALNSLAQNHANDMIQRNFFGHKNPDGNGPEERRVQAGISTEVGENLAYSESLISSMQGLLRSPIHRNNILSPAWTKVGIGITQDATGMLKIAQEFSPDALTTTKLAALQSEIITAINNQRNSKSLSALQSDNSLTNIAKNWSDNLAATNELSLITKNGQSLKEIIKKTNLAQSLQLFIFSTNSTGDIVTRIAEPSSALDGTWNKIGLGLSVTNLGEIKVTMLLSK